MIQYRYLEMNLTFINQQIIFDPLAYNYITTSSAEEHISLLFDLCRGDDEYGKASIKTFFEVMKKVELDFNSNVFMIIK